MIRLRLQLLCLIALSYSAIAWSQVPAGASRGQAPLTGLRSLEKVVWHVFGRVTSLSGEPVSEVIIRVNIGTGRDGLKTLQTDLQGSFATQYELPVEQYKRLSVTVVASKTGYLDARETVDFGAADQTWGIDLTLRENSRDPDQLSEADLIDYVAPRLRQAAATDLKSTPAAKDWERGVHELLEQHDSARALPALRKVVQREPACVECNLMLGLAQMDAGAWNSAARQFSEAAKLASGQKSARGAEPLLILGVLESWQHQPKKAAGFFMQALAVTPNDPLVLQELGRVVERFNTDEATVLILVQAVAWLDSATYHIIRMRTDLLKPAPRIRLTRQTTEIQFSEVHFKEMTSAYWLPHEVVVTVEWKGQTFRNVHQYSDFKLFDVQSNEKRKAAQLAPPAAPSSLGIQPETERWALPALFLTGTSLPSVIN